MEGFMVLVMKNAAARSTSILFALFSPLLGGVLPVTGQDRPSKDGLNSEI